MPKGLTNSQIGEAMFHGRKGRSRTSLESDGQKWAWPAYRGGRLRGPGWQSAAGRGADPVDPDHVEDHDAAPAGRGGVSIGAVHISTRMGAPHVEAPGGVVDARISVLGVHDERGDRLVTSSNVGKGP